MLRDWRTRPSSQSAMAFSGTPRCSATARWVRPSFSRPARSSSGVSRCKWERRAALIKAGYIETRELRLRHSLAAEGAAWDFFRAFHSRFPGVERSVRDAGSDEPVVVVTARKSDFGPLGAIERFVRQYEPAR